MPYRSMKHVFCKAAAEACSFGGILADIKAVDLLQDGPSSVRAKQKCYAKEGRCAKSSRWIEAKVLLNGKADKI